MARWAPDARTRLQEAATELFAQRGYDAVTAAEIAARADVTERTFFRHFADKREVLFANEDAMLSALVDGVRAAPEDADVGALLRAGLDAVAAVLEPRRADLRRRMPLIASHPALRERELAKQDATAAALADALRERGAPDAHAELAGQVAIVALRPAFDAWLADDGGPPLRRRIAAALRALNDVTALAATTAAR
jgi:AcrR family transcriptional regulator